MRNAIQNVVALIALCALSAAALAQGQPPRGQPDVFKGKLFPPNVILEHREALGLSREQFTAMFACTVTTAWRTSARPLSEIRSLSVVLCEIAT